MRTALAAAGGFFAGVLLVIVLGGAGDSKTKTVTVPATISGGGTVIVSVVVPQLVGQPLDVAHERLDRSKLDLAVRSGGGAFGVVVESNWEVTAQDPPPGTKLEQGSTVHVDIQRK